MAAAKRLVVTADDLGADEARNAGIAEAVAAGAVTSVSLLANGPALEDALGRLPSLRPRVSVGVHLNLSEGAPLARGLRLLVGSDGLFLGKASARDLLHRRGDPTLTAEVGRELTAQVERLQAAAGPLDHLDGHQHVHVFPAVVDAAFAAASRGRIPWVRIPEEPWPADGGAEGLDEELRAFLRAARAARALLGGAGLSATDHFRGLFLRDRLTPSRLDATVAALPEGLTELMVHPGRAAERAPATSFSRFSTPERERELAALLSPEFRAALARARVTLTPFPAAG